MAPLNSVYSRCLNLTKTQVKQSTTRYKTQQQLSMKATITRYKTQVNRIYLQQLKMKATITRYKTQVKQAQANRIFGFD